MFLKELPCPFCGSTDLVDGLWSIDDQEVDAIECSNCAAGAPLVSWRKRRDTQNESTCEVAA